MLWLAATCSVDLSCWGAHGTIYLSLQCNIHLAWDMALTVSSCHGSCVFTRSDQNAISSTMMASAPTWQPTCISHLSYISAERRGKVF